MSAPGPSAIIASTRRVLLVILLLALVGTAAELLLLGHHENAWRLIPLLFIGLTVAVLARHALHGRPAGLRALLFVVSGAVRAGTS
jgi:hypothetical protein